MDQLIESLQKLQKKVSDTGVKRYYKYKTLKTHLCPLTNVAFDKLGKRYSQSVSIIIYGILMIIPYNSSDSW